MLKVLTRPLLAMAALTALASPASAAWAPLTGQYTTTGRHIPGVTLMLEQSGSQVRGSVSIVADQMGQRVVASDFTGYTSRGVLRFDWADT